MVFNKKRFSKIEKKGEIYLPQSKNNIKIYYLKFIVVPIQCPRIEGAINK